MVNKFSQFLVGQLTRNGIIEKGRAEEYVYGLEMLFEKVISYTILVILAVAIDMLVPSLVFLVFFLTLREWGGGFHASTYGGGLIGTILIYLFCSKILVDFFMVERMTMYIALAVTSVCILALAPVNHPNLSLTEKEMGDCRMGVRVALFAELAAILVGIAMRIDSSYIIFASMGVIMCGVLLLVAKILRQEVKPGEKGGVQAGSTQINQQVGGITGWDDVDG